MRVVDDGHGPGKYPFAQFVLEERGAAGDGDAVYGAGQMGEQAAGGAGIVDHGHLRRFHLARLQAAHGLFARGPADVLGLAQVLGEDGAGVIVIPFHRRPLAGQHRDAEAVPRRPVDAGEPVAGGDGHLHPAPTGLGAFRVGHAGHAARGVLGPRRPLHQRLRRGFGGIADVQIRAVGGQQVRPGQAAVGVLGHRAGHGEDAPDQLLERARGQIGGRRDGLALAHEHAQAHIGAFRTVQPLRPSQAPGQRQRPAAHEHGVGSVRAGRPGLADEVAEQVEFIVCGVHAGPRPSMVSYRGTGQAGATGIVWRRPPPGGRKYFSSAYDHSCSHPGNVQYIVWMWGEPFRFAAALPRVVSKFRASS